VRQEVRVSTASSDKSSAFSLIQLFQERSRLKVFSDILIEARQPKNVFRIVETSMGNVAHEAQDDAEVMDIDLVTLFNALPNEPQYFQTAENHLMIPDTRNGRLHKTSRICVCRITLSALVR